MEYQVPQFIEVESKIVGPLTLRQFIYLAGGAGLCLAAFFYLPIWLGIPLIVGIGALALALAFYRVNGKPFIEMLEAGFTYYTGSKLFIWKHKEPKPEKAAPTPTMQAAQPTSTRATPRLSSGKLSELAWSLDVQNKPQEEILPKQ